MNPTENNEVKVVVEETVSVRQLMVTERPVLITIICSYFLVRWAFGILTLLFAIIMRPGGVIPSFTDIFSQAGPIFLGVNPTDPHDILLWAIVSAVVVGIIGIWFMRMWALIIYSAATIAFFVYMINQIPGPRTSEVWYELISLFVINIAVIVIGAIYFKRMRN